MTKPTDATQAAPPGGDIHKRMIAIMRELPAIGKDRRNTQQNYNFRGIDDVYNLVSPIMAKHGVFMLCEVLSEATSERPAKSGGVLITRSAKLRYRFIAEDGSSVTTEVIGEGMDSGDKAANKALSVGQKYAILQAFLIPTDDPKDPEVDSPEPATFTVKYTGGKPPREVTETHDLTDPAVSPFSGDFFDEPAAPSQFHLLDKFTAAKKQLGAELYYEVLGRYKFKHATDIEPDERQAVLEEMRMAYKAAKGGRP